jgi:hypothetical protein
MFMACSQVRYGKKRCDLSSVGSNSWFDGRQPGPSLGDVYVVQKTQAAVGGRPCSTRGRQGPRLLAHKP